MACSDGAVSITPRSGEAFNEEPSGAIPPLSPAGLPVQPTTTQHTHTHTHTPTHTERHTHTHTQTQHPAHAEKADVSKLTLPNHKSAVISTCAFHKSTHSCTCVCVEE